MICMQLYIWHHKGSSLKVPHPVRLGRIHVHSLNSRWRGCFHEPVTSDSQGSNLTVVPRLALGLDIKKMYTL